LTEVWDWLDSGAPQARLFRFGALVEQFCRSPGQHAVMRTGRSAKGQACSRSLAEPGFPGLVRAPALPPRLEARRWQGRRRTRRKIDQNQVNPKLRVVTSVLRAIEPTPTIPLRTLRKVPGDLGMQRQDSPRPHSRPGLGSLSLDCRFGKSDGCRPGWPIQRRLQLGEIP